jgi:hypothetical protein
MAALSKKIIISVLFVGIIFSQYFYDAEKAANPRVQMSLSPQFVRSLDLGLHSALASFFWIDTRTELPFFREGYQKFFDDLNLINNLDPKFSTPYFFSTLVLPYTKYPKGIEAAVEIGRRGVAEADPDWRVPFYLATIYHLYLNDQISAAKYFDMAAQEPNVPELVKRFAINYGIQPKIREQTKQVWLAIYESTDNEVVKERAKAYIIHYEIIDSLQNAVGIYKEKYGVYPATPQDLVDKRIINGIPPDPFGLEFQIYEGGVVGIKQLPQN